MKQDFLKVPLPEIDWDGFNEFARIEPMGLWWTCPACSHTTTARIVCKVCGRKRILLREGSGPRGGEIFGWYMKIDWE